MPHLFFEGIQFSFLELLSFPLAFLACFLSTISAEINTVTNIKNNSKTIDPHQIMNITDLINSKNNKSA